jgi:hypothetical protein
MNAMEEPKETQQAERKKENKEETSKKKDSKIETGLTPITRRRMRIRRW